MVVLNQSQMGKGLAIPSDPHHTPTFIQPYTQPQKTKQPKKPKRKDTQVPHPSDPIESVADDVVHKELGDSLVRAAITASSLEAEQDIGNTLRSDEDRLKLDEFMALCTTLRYWVLDLEKTKNTQHNEIVSLKRRVKKLEKKNRSRTHKLKRLYKVGLTARVESSNNEESLGEDESKQERIDAIDDITLAQALKEMKSTKPKKKGVIIQELGESITTISSQLSSQQSQDKGKVLLIELVKPMKKKDLMRLDEETALNLQAEFDEEERLARDKAEKEKEANISLIETCDDIQEKINADHQLAERMQAQEQKELSIEENATLFQ
ncbi:hypothetical protein Tco_0469074 [Tanacetum coccineum]